MLGTGKEDAKILMVVSTSYIMNEAQRKMKIHGALLGNY